MNDSAIAALFSCVPTNTLRGPFGLNYLPRGRLLSGVNIFSIINLNTGSSIKILGVFHSCIV